MNRWEYVDFFHASNSSHYKLIFFALSKIFDRDARASGFVSLKAALRAANHAPLADHVDKQLSTLTECVARIGAIRNRTIAHNQTDSVWKDVYEENGITPDDICELIEKC